jgi:hypothetical protein
MAPSERNAAREMARNAVPGMVLRQCCCGRSANAVQMQHSARAIVFHDRLRCGRSANAVQMQPTGRPWLGRFATCCGRSANAVQMQHRVPLLVGRLCCGRSTNAVRMQHQHARTRRKDRREERRR